MTFWKGSTEVERTTPGRGASRRKMETPPQARLGHQRTAANREGGAAQRRRNAASDVNSEKKEAAEDEAWDKTMQVMPVLGTGSSQGTRITRKMPLDWTIQGVPAATWT